MLTCPTKQIVKTNYILSLQNGCFPVSGKLMISSFMQETGSVRSHTPDQSWRHQDPKAGTSANRQSRLSSIWCQKSYGYLVFSMPSAASVTSPNSSFSAPCSHNLTLGYLEHTSCTRNISSTHADETCPSPKHEKRQLRVAVTLPPERSQKRLFDSAARYTRLMSNDTNWYYHVPK